MIVNLQLRNQVTGDVFPFAIDLPANLVPGEIVAHPYVLEQAPAVLGAALDMRKAIARQVIDAKAGEVRRRFITWGPGQEASYLKKEQEARAWQAAGNTGTPADYPWLSAAARAQAHLADVAGLTAAAAVIVGRADLWSGVVGPAIEEARERGHIEVEAAADASLVDGAVQDATAALDAIGA